MKVQLRKEIMRKLWRLLDVAGEEKVEATVRNLKKEILEG